MRVALALLIAFFTTIHGATETRPRGRDRGIPFPGEISTHDNVTPAGRVDAGELRLSLWAGVGHWFPRGPGSTQIEVEALGEDGRALQIPSPFVRAVQGTVVRASIRNTLASPLHIHGLCDRPGPCDPIPVPAGVSREVRFTLNAPGTFHYWVATEGRTLASRRVRDSQLGGAIVVDPPGTPAPDRIFVLGLVASDTTVPEVVVINGRSWPHTERLTYAVGDTARWRVVNLTNISHAMHLHGFYFQVDSSGDGVRDTHYSDTERRLAVTEQMPPGRAISMTWIPERPGNWLFHCHMLDHMMDVRDPSGGSHATHVATAASAAVDAGMAGLVLGIHVTGVARTPVVPDSARRRLELIVEPDSRNGAIPSYKVNIVGSGTPAPRLGDRAVPGPIMVLTRGEPVAVEVVNRLSEPTAIHWHGIELESYDDGVPGFGGTTGSVTPPVLAGGSFTARFTPPRAGTFIYHTHWHNAGQLAGGIYGPLVVLEPGQTYDPATDHVVVLGLDGAYRPAPNEPFVVNGERKPRPVELRPGVAHRFRFINITADNVALTMQLVSRFDPIQWTLVAKDGAQTPPSQQTARPARQLVSVGETYDFEIAPPSESAANLWFELRRGSGELLIQWPVQVR